MCERNEHQSKQIEFELSPSWENVAKSYLNNPKSRDDAINNFIELICSVKSHVSIAIDASWGSGKTFYIKQAKMILDLNNPHLKKQYLENVDTTNIKADNISELIANNPHVCVYYDAWRYDNHDDPILSLIYSITREFATNVKNDSEDFLTCLEDLVSIFDKVLPVNAKGFFDLLKDLSGKDIIEKIVQQEQLKDKINAFLNSLKQEKGNRIVIFIDELDRCSPLYAIRLLERIKHYFDNESITFIFSINKKELCQTIKKVYGYDFNAEKYLERFFDMTMPLPQFDMSAYCESIMFKDPFENTLEIINDIQQTLGLTMREVSKLIRNAYSFSAFYNNLKSGGHYREEILNTIVFLYKLLVLPLLGLIAEDGRNKEILLAGNGYDLYKNLADNIKVFDILSERLSEFDGIKTKDDISKRIYASYSEEYAKKNNITPISRFIAIKDVMKTAFDLPETFSNQPEIEQ